MLHLQHIAELGPLLGKFGVTQVVISPGSRNAPLIQLFTANKKFQCHSIVDERSAGYVALGMARQSGQPVVVVTTSGTAVLNLAPAVAEAYHQQIPLIILTADRTLEAIPQFDNQVVDQSAPFFSHSRGFFEMPLVPRSEPELGQVVSSVKQLISAATADPGGPVHINIPLSEPLYQALPQPIQTEVEIGNTAYGHEKEGVIKPWPGHKKILVLAGMGKYDDDVQSMLVHLTRSRSLVVVAENIANLVSEQFIANPELILAGLSKDDQGELAPDVVIAFGGQVVSKRMKLFIQSLKDAQIMVIDGNPFRELSSLNSGVDMEKPVTNEYLAAWKRCETACLASAVSFLSEAPFSNLLVVHQTLADLPGGAVVHLGNSSSVRYAQLMPVKKSVSYYSNRGTSGIDGCVSAAVGAAMVSDQLHLLIVGDLSFVYDSNALWNGSFPSNLKIIVLNDGGGGIFRLIDGPDQMEFFESFSVTHHPVSIEMLSQSFGRRSLRVSNSKELADALRLLFDPGSNLSVMEADTSRSENSRIFKAFMNRNSS